MFRELVKAIVTMASKKPAFVFMETRTNRLQAALCAEVDDTSFLWSSTEAAGARAASLHMDKGIRFINLDFARGFDLKPVTPAHGFIWFNTRN